MFVCLLFSQQKSIQHVAAAYINFQRHLHVCAQEAFWKWNDYICQVCVKMISIYSTTPHCSVSGWHNQDLGPLSLDSCLWNEFKFLSFCFCEKTPGQRFMTWSLDIRVVDEILQRDLLKQTRNNNEVKKFLRRLIFLLTRKSLIKVDSLHTPAPVVGFPSQR